jgi:hypothetical protein
MRVWIYYNGTTVFRREAVFHVASLDKARKIIIQIVTMHNSKLSDVPYHALQCCTQRELFEVLISLTHERLFGSGSSPNSAREQRSCSQIIVMLCLCTRRLYSNRLFF